jgi:hypothetical protein
MAIDTPSTTSIGAPYQTSPGGDVAAGSFDGGGGSALATLAVVAAKSAPIVKAQRLRGFMGVRGKQRARPRRGCERAGRTAWKDR